MFLVSYIEHDGTVLVGAAKDENDANRIMIWREVDRCYEEMDAEGKALPPKDVMVAAVIANWALRGAAYKIERVG